MRKPKIKKELVVAETLEEQALLDATPQAVRVEALGNFCLDGCTIEMAIDRINNTSDSLHKQGYSNLVFELEYFGYDGASHLSIRGERLETPNEIKRRIANAEAYIVRARAAAVATEKKERALLKSLKKKYPNE